MEMHEFSGTVKVFNQIKSYGFISMDAGRDVFFHIKDCIDKSSIHEGAVVRFLIVVEEEKRRAVGVKRVA